MINESTTDAWPEGMYLELESRLYADENLTDANDVRFPAASLEIVTSIVCSAESPRTSATSTIPKSIPPASPVTEIPLRFKCADCTWAVTSAYCWRFLWYWSRARWASQCAAGKSRSQTGQRM